jgi:nitrogen regulatory protein PII-like uncharacterized protein
MNVTWGNAGKVIGVLLGISGLIAASYQAAVWFDDIYIDTNEAQRLIDMQIDILRTMNDNIVNIGSAIYDRKIAEIDSWIKDLEARTNLNLVEKAFLTSLHEKKAEILTQKGKLSRVKLGD